MTASISSALCPVVVNSKKCSISFGRELWFLLCSLGCRVNSVVMQYDADIACYIVCLVTLKLTL
jgi:hypothetical protein